MSSKPSAAALRAASKYTPGPWRILRQGKKSWVVAGGDPAKDPLDFDGQVIASETTCPDWDANAHLIAAAPDLLKALEPIGAAYPDDPGTSDLYDEQPVTITLGDVRRAWRALHLAEKGRVGK